MRTLVGSNFHQVGIEPKVPRSCEFARETISLVFFFLMLKYPTFYLFKQFLKLIFIGV